MNTFRENIRYAMGQCSMGYMLVAVSEKGVSAIFMADTQQALFLELFLTYPNAQLTEEKESLLHLTENVTVLIDNPRANRTFDLDIRGTNFQRRVWQALTDIPVGETRTYQQIAVALGDANAVRAVAGACAANVLAVAIPCHRVVRKDKSLSGYRWGTERKCRLLNVEAA